MRSRAGATILGVIMLALAVALVVSASLRAEGNRTLGEVPNKSLYIRTASVTAPLTGGEVVDLTTATAAIAAGFGPNHRSFTVCIENEDTDSGDDLLVQFQSVGGFTATTLTTPADATVSTVMRIRANMQPVCVDIQGVGWIWQSETADLVNANAIVSW